MWASWTNHSNKYPAYWLFLKHHNSLSKTAPNSLSKTSYWLFLKHHKFIVQNRTDILMNFSTDFTLISWSPNQSSILFESAVVSLLIRLGPFSVWTGYQAALINGSWRMWCVMSMDLRATMSRIGVHYSRRSTTTSTTQLILTRPLELWTLESTWSCPITLQYICGLPRFLAHN